MISLGLGFFVESDFNEARAIIEKRKNYLNEKLEKKEMKYSEIESQIRTVKITHNTYKHTKLYLYIDKINNNFFKIF